MPDLVVIAPSRGRPHAARGLVSSMLATCTADTEVLFAVDESDVAGDDYPDRTIRTASHSMVEALNLAVARALASPRKPFAVAFFGDDHRPRTVGWDTAYLDALRELGTGMVYGDDLIQGEHLPTQIAMTADIPDALGWMAPPELHHLYVDNAWLALGLTADCIRYLPGVVVEHQHPSVGTAPMDDGYLRVNSSTMYRRDQDAFDRWMTAVLPSAAATVRALRGAHG